MSMEDQQTAQSDRSKPIGTLDYSSPGNEKWRWMSKRTWVEWALVVAIVGALVLMLLPVLSSTDRGRPSVACMSNLRQIGIALEQYATRNNGVYPARLVDAFTPWMQTRYFVCPSSTTEVPAAQGATVQQSVANILAGNNHISYVYVIGGKSAAALKPGAVAAYDPPGNHSSGSRGIGTVLFVDGHCSSVPIAQFKQMIKELNAGQNPPPVLKGRY